MNETAFLETVIKRDRLIVITGLGVVVVLS